MGFLSTLRKSTRRVVVAVPVPDRSSANLPTGATMADQARIVASSRYQGGTAIDTPGLLRKLGRRK